MGFKVEKGKGGRRECTCKSCGNRLVIDAKGRVRARDFLRLNAKKTSLGRQPCGGLLPDFEGVGEKDDEHRRKQREATATAAQRVGVARRAAARERANGGGRQTLEEEEAEEDDDNDG
jgi:hypothetical protein